MSASIKSLLRLWFIALGAVTLACGQPVAPPFPHQLMGVANGCFVESVAFGDDFRTRFGDEAWQRLLQWGAKEDEEVVAGHAVAVFEHKRQLWCYDINRGFKVLATPVTQREDVEAVAKEVTLPYVNKITPRFPVYREDFRRLAPHGAPVPYAGVMEADLRDAGVVAERLAKHRPVALVEFTYPKDGDVKRGAAVVFLYHGRLCVYTPENGTVPFRAEAQSLKNMRQLQLLLRRIYPGASNLKAR
jgi:hypothetical protein